MLDQKLPMPHFLIEMNLIVYIQSNNPVLQNLPYITTVLFTNSFTTPLYAIFVQSGKNDAEAVIRGEDDRFAPHFDKTPGEVPGPV